MVDPENFPTTIGRYEVKRLLGEGAMGSVYLAEDPRIKRKLAIKVVKVDAIRSEGDRKEFLARFQREAEVSGVLNDPGIVTIYDVGDSEMGPFMAMEFVQGRPLDAVIKSGEIATMPVRQKLQIAAGIASALDHAHSHGIVHRDVKPGNVMLHESGRPKLMDFGIAKKEDASLTQTGTFLGTPSYASPEQIREGKATSRSDVFSFGVMVFEMLSGTLPFPGTSINTILYKIVNEPPAEIQPPVTGLLPEAWGRIFNKGLAKNPNERYPNCSQFVRDLVEASTVLDKDARMELLGLLKQSALSASAPPMAETLVMPSVVKKDKGHGLLIAIAAGATALLVGGGIFLGRRGGDRVTLEVLNGPAQVLKEGKVLGKTPFILNLRDGEQIRLERKGFKPLEVTYKAGQPLPKLELEGLIQEVTLVTQPEGAMAVLDSRPLDKPTPVKVSWDLGKKHDLTFTHKGQNLNLSLQFLEGEIPAEKAAYTLLPADQQRSDGVPKAVDVNAPGSLRSSASYGVRVKANGKEMGELGAGGKLSLPPGTYKLELSQPNVRFKDNRTVNVGPGQVVNLPLPDLANVVVDTFPGAGTVVIDGIPTTVQSDGETPIRVVKGTHNIGIQGTKVGKTLEVVKDTEVVKLHVPRN